MVRNHLHWNGVIRDGRVEHNRGVVEAMKHQRTVMVFALASAAFGGTWLGVQAASRDLPTVVRTAEAVTPVVARGGELRIEYTVTRHRSCSVVVDRFIYDRFKTRFELPDIAVGSGLPLGEDRFIQPITIPPDAEPGPAVYRTLSTYICNPLQRLFPIDGGSRDISFLIK